MEQALDYYSKIQAIYKAQDKNALAKTYFGDILILAQTNYVDRSFIEDAWKEAKRNLNKEKEFGELTGIRMNFYGNGKIVSLKHPSKEPIDSRLRGKSAFWFKFESSDRIRGQFSNIDLYLPKGEILESLRRVEY